MIDINPKSIETIRAMLTAASSDLRFGPAAEPMSEFAALQAEMLRASGGTEVWIVCTTVNGEELCAAVTGNGPRSKANAELFAHAPIIIDSLMSKVDALEAELAAERANSAKFDQTIADAIDEAARLRAELAEARARVFEHSGAETDKRVARARREGAREERGLCLADIATIQRAPHPEYSGAIRVLGQAIDAIRARGDATPVEDEDGTTRISAHLASPSPIHGARSLTDREAAFLTPVESEDGAT